MAPPEVHGYRLFDQPVHSELPLSGLPACAVDEHGVGVRLTDGAALNEAGFRWIHDWKTASGAVTASCARRGETYLIRFPGLADFQIQLAPPCIEVFPAPVTTMATLTHLLVDQVIPRLLGHLGRVVLHASGAVLPGGRAVALVGDSGRGKSTLAASLFQSGWPLLADDCLQLDLIDGDVHALGAYPSLRLWPESAHALFRESPGFEEVAHYSTKRQLQLTDANGDHRGAAALAAIFLLNNPEQGRDGDDVRIEAIGGADAAMAMIEAAFVLDVVSREAVSAQFRQVARIAQSGVPLNRLSYPRRFDRLPRVRSAILAQVQG